MPKIKRSYSTILLFFIVLALFFTRLWNLSWGLPFPFHPDERNMAVSVQQLSCPDVTDIKNCLNPNFFAYGQFPLYLAFFLDKTARFFTHNLQGNFSLPETTLILRIISAFFSIATVWLFWKIIEAFDEDLNLWLKSSILFIFIFSPALIQFAHFGTTESALLFFYTAITYVSLLLAQSKISERKFIITSSVLIGLSVATKISSGIFAVLPVLSYLYHFRTKKKSAHKLTRLFIWGALSGFIAVLFSPHNLISFNDFISAINYESAVAQGTEVFYTRSFFHTIPILYQSFHIFPYSLGLPVFILFILGLFFLPWKKEFNLLRISFLIYFLPTAFLYAKWSRFMAPVIPIMILIASLLVIQIYKKLQKMQFLVYFLIFLSVINGIAFMSVYLKSDIRLEASRWIYNTAPSGSYLLSETANVVDIPIDTQDTGKAYILNSFDFYHLDENQTLQSSLKKAIDHADYIIIPSRRVFKNNTCFDEFTLKKNNSPACKELIQKYPLVNAYYENLFNGNLGFEKVAEFSSYPEITIGEKSLILPDEDAEETWTVFDHPVIRIYKKM